MIYQDDLDFAAFECADEFWAEVESEASKLEVTVDYYLEEFYID